MLDVQKGWGAYTHMEQLIGSGATPAQIAKLIAWVLDAADAADSEVRNLDVDGEMKDGILHVTGKLREAFTPSNIGNNMVNFFPALPQTLGSLKSFLKLTGLDRPGQPELSNDLLAEIEQVLGSKAFADLDPQMAQLARRHLRLLTITLNHLDAFGVDGAMIAYAELIVKLQAAMRDAPAAQQKKGKGFMDVVGGWAAKLRVLNEAYETGTKLIENASDVVDLLGVG
ncbi:hypothetical protein [uncultured Phenylobacterium sp.]|uniref:hypothetical protein n=1 Tax=uncultured Phenylobacterium sp. TaxID=349273 RepID=UPI0025F00237|nr:hypothetical protein [uncultured Phenylobacterium sp.]